ncbi:MAG: GTPase ObgE [Chloroflexi bacterium]|nr:GTPase ObgE [Chloroflexota bacterium]
MFADHAEIIVHAGNGGDGSAHFRREKFVPFGGPDGGDGGRGGSIYLVGETNLNTLGRFVHQHEFRAGHGGHGGGNRRHGAKGHDLIIRVPAGTIVRLTGSDTVLADIMEPGRRVLVARGGRGGLGNVHFATATNQAPRVADRGEPGETLALHLELKLIAEVGLVGLPNAGKSTFLAAVSRAQPKIGAYPFTTLEPNLGVATVGDRSFVVADIPGLIEGAHRGVGLGHDFLRHVQRTRLLLHLVDGSGLEGHDPAHDIEVIVEELQQFDPELVTRPRLLVVNKSDLPETHAYFQEIRRRYAHEHEVFLVSAATHDGLSQLLQRVAALLDELPSPPAVEVTARPEMPEFWIVSVAERLVRVEGPIVDRVTSQTDFRERDAIERLRRRLIQLRVPQAVARSHLVPLEVQVGPAIWRLEEGKLSWSRWEDEDAESAE